MGAAPECRLANSADIDVLSALGSRVFRDTYGHTAPRAHVERHINRNFGADAIGAAMREPGVEYHIALVDKGCAGLLKLRDSAAPPATGADRAVEVHQLYVAAGHQGLGIGRLLMDRAVVTARARGAAGVWLSVWSEADWATGFYQRYGFTNCGTEPFCMGGTEHIDYIMWLALDDAAASRRQLRP